MSRGDDLRAAAKMEQLLDSYREQKLQALNVLVERGFRALDRGEAPGAVDALEQAHLLVVDIFGKGTEEDARATGELGLACSAAGRYADAAKRFGDCISIYDDLEIRDFRRGRAQVRLANVHRLQGDYAVAERLFRAILAEESDDPLSALLHAYAMDDLAGALSRTGRETEAESLRRGALAIFETHTDLDATAVCLGGLGELCLRSQRHREAEGYFRRALAIRRERGDNGGALAKDMDNLARALLWRGRNERRNELFDEAIALGTEALASASAVLPTGHPTILHCENNLAVYRHAQKTGGGSPDVDPDRTKALAQALAPSHPEVINALLREADSLSRTDAHDAAREKAFDAVNLLREVVGPEGREAINAERVVLTVLWRHCWHLQEKLQRERGLDQEDSKKYTASLKFAADLGKTFVSRALSLPFWRQATAAVLRRPTSDGWGWVRPYVDILRLARLHERISHAELYINVFSLLLARGGEMASLLQARLVEREDTQRSALLGEYRQLAVRLAVLEERDVATALDPGSHPRSGDGATSSGPLRTELAAVEEKLSASSTEQLFSIAPTDVQQALGEGEAVVCYLVGNNKLVVTVATREALMLQIVEWESWNIGELCRKYEASVQLDNVETLEGIPRVDFDTAETLYRLLFSAIEGELENISTLFIVPDEELATIPFGALLRDKSGMAADAGLQEKASVEEIVTKLAEKGPLEPCLSAARNGAWVADRYAISIVPSVGWLVRTRRSRSEAGERLPFLGIGSPLSGDQNISYDMDELLETLGAAFEAEPSSILRGADATLGRIRELEQNGELARYRVLCFATHGVLPTADAELLWEPGLQLTAADGDEGVLWATDVARLRLDADWVFLVACDSASAEGRALNQPLSGLPRAFLTAGARALLVSHWMIDVRATRAIVEATVDAERIGRTRAEAFKEAAELVRNRRDRPEYAHPGYWAALSIVGDGGG